MKLYCGHFFEHMISMISVNYHLTWPSSSLVEGICPSGKLLCLWQPPKSKQHKHGNIPYYLCHFLLHIISIILVNYHLTWLWSSLEEGIIPNGKLLCLLRPTISMLHMHGNIPYLFSHFLVNMISMISNSSFNLTMELFRGSRLWQYQPKW